MVEDKVALHVHAVVAIEHGGVELVGRHRGGGTEVGGEGALRVGGDEGGGDARVNVGVDEVRGHTEVLHLFAEKVAHRVVAHLADVAGGSTQTGKTVDGVGGGAASGTHLLHLRDALMQLALPVRVNHHHTALVQAVGGQYLIIVDVHKHIDKGISYS